MNFWKPNDRQPQRQSEDGAKPGLQPALYIVATPIGNARDITLRALDVLSAADAILAEDTRVTAKLLSLHGLKRPLIAVHDHNESAIASQVIARIQGGQALALVSDAGTPLVSDPGYKLVRAAIAAGVPVTPLPGASSALAGLVMSGLPPDRFFFCGFLPPKQGARRTALASLKDIPATLIFLEAPSRLAASLEDMAETFGPRPAAVARELTKMFEECVRGDLAALAHRYAGGGPPKGELVVLVGPAPDKLEIDDDSLDRALRTAMNGQPLGKAASEVAAAFDLPRRQVYERALILAGKKGGA
jgi:16S rRNA (cytidine1402-2'-O)-methyltransferase